MSALRDVSLQDPRLRYELVQRIGSGTYGDVYKGRDTDTGELAAIKIVKIDPGDDIGSIQQEITTLRDCRHHNVVTYFGSYLRNDRLWICMEYCAGGSLQEIYHKKNTFLSREVYNSSKKVARTHWVTLKAQINLQGASTILIGSTNDQMTARKINPSILHRAVRSFLDEKRNVSFKKTKVQ